MNYAVIYDLVAAILLFGGVGVSGYLELTLATQSANIKKKNSKVYYKMKDSFNIMLLPVIGLILVGVLTYGPTNSYINDLFGGGSEKAECAVCTKVTYNGYFTNWTVSHLLLFVVLGYMFPNYSTLLIAGGIFWELVELYFDLVSHNYEDSALCQYLLECSKSFKHVNSFWKHYDGTKATSKSLYWSSGGLVGSLLDTLADILGVYVGVWLAHRVGSR